MKTYLFSIFFVLGVLLSSAQENTNSIGLCPTKKQKINVNFCDRLSTIIEQSNNKKNNKSTSEADKKLYQKSIDSLEVLQKQIATINNINYDRVLKLCNFLLKDSGNTYVIENSKEHKETITVINSIVTNNLDIFNDVSNEKPKTEVTNTNEPNNLIKENNKLTKAIYKLKSENENLRNTNKNLTNKIKSLEGVSFFGEFKNKLIQLFAFVGILLLIVFYFIVKTKRKDSKDLKKKKRDEYIKKDQIIFSKEYIELEKKLKEKTKENEKLLQKNKKSSSITVSNPTQEEKQVPIQEEIITQQEVTPIQQEEKPIYYYHNDIEDDGSLKKSKASTQQAGWHRYVIKELDNNITIEILDKQEYIDIVVTKKLYMLDPLFDSKPSSDTTKNIIKTIKPAQLKYSDDGKYWLLKDKGLIEFNRVD